MSKIIKNFEEVNHSVSTGFTKDLGLFSVNATVWSCVTECENGYDNDITETELTFLLNGKVCKYLGFKELYEKLYGVNMFDQFYAHLIVEFEEEYFKQSPYKTK